MVVSLEEVHCLSERFVVFVRVLRSSKGRLSLKVLGFCFAVNSVGGSESTLAGLVLLVVHVKST